MNTSPMASIGLLEVLLAVVAFLIIRYCIRQNNGLPTNYPIIGMLPYIYTHLGDFHEKTAELLDRTGCNFLFKSPWLSADMFCTADPINIRYIMSSNFENFPKGEKFAKIFDVLGYGIFNADSDSWRDQRKIAQGLMNHQRFHQFLVRTCRSKLEKGLIPILDYVAKKGSVVDLQDLFQRFTFDVTCMLVTGYDPECLSADFPEVKFSKAMDIAMEVIFYRHIRPGLFWKLQRLLGIGKEGKMIKASADLHHVVSEYISRKREELWKSCSFTENEDGVDLLTSYLKDAEFMGSKPDDKFLRDTILNLFLAGRDTVSSALTWFLWNVSTNHQVEDKIREELKMIARVKEAENLPLFEPQELKDLLYFHGAVCESLRLYPPVPFQHKAPVKADVLPSGHRIDPKKEILFSLYAMARIKPIWGEDCSEFKPERWITESGRIKYEPPSKFLAFNAGPRTCLGKEVALTEIKVVAASVIHSYQIQVVEEHPVVPNLSVILHMKHGLKVRVVRRCVT